MCAIEIKRKIYGNGISRIVYEQYILSTYLVDLNWDFLRIYTYTICFLSFIDLICFLFSRDDMPPYDMPHYGGGGMMHGRGPPPNWGPGPNMGPPQEGTFAGPTGNV